MRLTESIFMVGSGPFGLSHEFDCSVYIIDCSGSLVMVDTGAGCNIKSIIENIKKDGLDPKNIDHILLTHSHADHGGGAAMIKNLYSSEVYISEIEAECLASADESMIKLDVAKRSGLYSPDYTFSPCDATVLLKNKDVTSRIDERTLREITNPLEYIGQSKEIIRVVYDKYYENKTLC